MSGSRSILLIALAFLALGAWFLLDSLSGPFGGDGWKAFGEDPCVILGSNEDRFAYAGGAGVRPVDGSLTFTWRAKDDVGSIQITLEAPSDVDFPFEAAPGDEILIRCIIGPDDAVQSDVTAHGNSGIGEPRLPETRALFVGTGRFDISVAGRSVMASRDGVWSLADALRKDDGSIRQQGLTFSPLLRDKTGFSDPSRLEFTLLLYDDTRGGISPVLLHLVFRTVHIPEASEGTIPP